MQVAQNLYQLSNVQKGWGIYFPVLNPYLFAKLVLVVWLYKFFGDHKFLFCVNKKSTERKRTVFSFKKRQ